MNNQEISSTNVNKKRGGRRPGAGRKSKAEEMGLQALLNKCWGSEERQHVVKSLYKAAQDGNVQAAALLMAYAYGKPTEKVEATITHREFEIEIGGDASQSDSEPQFIN